MADEPVDIARAQVEQAELPSTIYRTARRLLDRAEIAGGTIRLTEAEFQAICQTEAEGTLRSHLVQLAGAGIIRYSRRGGILIHFEAWAEPQLVLGEEVTVQRSLRAVSDHFANEGEAEVIAGRSERALSDHLDNENQAEVIVQRSKRALSDQNGGDPLTHAPARALVGGGLSDPSSTRRSRKKPTNHQPTLADAHQQLAFNLLVDREVGIDFEVAQILARTLPLLDIYRVVDDWLPERWAGKVRPASLRYRLERAKPTYGSTVTLSPDFRNSDVYRRHPLPAEMVRDPTRRNYLPDEYADIILGKASPEALAEYYGSHNVPHPDDYTDFDP